MTYTGAARLKAAVSEYRERSNPGRVEGFERFEGFEACEGFGGLVNDAIYFHQKLLQNIPH